MYIPKNRLITNLKTNQGEFVYKDTNVPYNGVYWKSYDGKYFTGKNPNNTPTKEIEIFTQLATDNSTSNINFQISFVGLS